jgi:hypothetical protein
MEWGSGGNSRKMKRLGKNLCPRDLFPWKIFMCAPAPIMKRIMKTTWAGMSTRLTGGPPSVHTIGAYGGPACDVLVTEALRNTPS